MVVLSMMTIVWLINDDLHLDVNKDMVMIMTNMKIKISIDPRCHAE